MAGRQWTDEERAYIRNNYVTMSCEEMSKHLPDRTKRAVQHEFNNMGLERPQPQVGDKLGTLEIVRIYMVDIGTQMKTKVDVLCDCGKTKTGIVLSAMVGGNTTSCGCVKAKKAGARMTEWNLKHGESDTPLYSHWQAMKTRATNPNIPCAHNYSLRGIGVCEEWMDYEPFRDWSLANGFDESLEIDRKDNNASYSPENCRWVTKVINSNNRRSNTLLAAFGETKTVAEWTRDPRCVVSYQCLCDRLNKLGWTNPEKAMVTPTGKQGRHSVK